MARDASIPVFSYDDYRSATPNLKDRCVKKGARIRPRYILYLFIPYLLIFVLSYGPVPYTLIWRQITNTGTEVTADVINTEKYTTRRGGRRGRSYTVTEYRFTIRYYDQYDTPHTIIESGFEETKPTVQIQYLNKTPSDYYLTMKEVPYANFMFKFIRLPVDIFLAMIPILWIRRKLLFRKAVIENRVIENVRIIGGLSDEKTSSINILGDMVSIMALFNFRKRDSSEAEEELSGGAPQTKIAPLFFVYHDDEEKYFIGKWTRFSGLAFSSYKKAYEDDKRFDVVVYDNGTYDIYA